MRPVLWALSGICLVAVLPALAAKGSAATLLSAENAGRAVSLRDVATSKDGEVSGEIVNNSRQTLRDIQLQILYSWRWKDEFHPGKDDPGMAVYQRLDKEIPPGQRTRFSYKPPAALPSRPDGYFETIVTVAGFSEVFRQDR